MLPVAMARINSTLLLPVAGQTPKVGQPRPPLSLQEQVQQFLHRGFDDPVDDPADEGLTSSQPPAVCEDDPNELMDPASTADIGLDDTANAGDDNQRHMDDGGEMAANDVRDDPATASTEAPQAGIKAASWAVEAVARWKRVHAETSSL